LSWNDCSGVFEVAEATDDESQNHDDEEDYNAHHADSVGAFRSRLETDLFATDYVTYRICNPAPPTRLPILVLYELFLD